MACVGEALSRLHIVLQISAVQRNSPKKYAASLERYIPSFQM